jgi:predicted nucleic acid-binding protein
MKVLDATFLIDYGNEVDAAAEYLLGHTGHRFIVPSPVLTEHLLGAVHSTTSVSVEEARAELAWVQVVSVGPDTAVTAAEVADDIGPQGPQLTGIDAIVAAVGRELNSAVVSKDSDLTHSKTQQVLDVDVYTAESA